MRNVFMSMLVCCLLAFGGCSERKAEELLETAKFEELQNNPKHATQLYEEILEKYPDTVPAKEARKRISALQEKTRATH